MNTLLANIDKLKPLVTEKALKLSDAGMVVFTGPKELDKKLTTNILEYIYKGNKVLNVKSVLVKGKVKTFKRKIGKRKDFKKFYVQFEKPIDITTEVK